MAKAKCIIILSSKSSGSSALQNLLSKAATIQKVGYTEHFKNETLYWTKAASILGLPQDEVLGITAPWGKEKSYQSLVKFLHRNVPGFVIPDDNREMIFEGWRALCYEFAPVFLEKSPHHLRQWSAVELIMEAEKQLTDIDFMFIGLVRNPIDTTYSAFKRWKVKPEKFQYEWLKTYGNLIRLKEVLGDRIVVVRYEDVISSNDSLLPVLSYCGLPEEKLPETYMHGRSVQKWRKNCFFGFQPAPEVVEMAKHFGYTDDELHVENKSAWPDYFAMMKLLHSIYSPLLSIYLKIKYMIIPKNS